MMHHFVSPVFVFTAIPTNKFQSIRLIINRTCSLLLLRRELLVFPQNEKSLEHHYLQPKGSILYHETIPPLKEIIETINFVLAHISLIKLEKLVIIFTFSFLFI